MLNILNRMLEVQQMQDKELTWVEWSVFAAVYVAGAVFVYLLSRAN